MYNLKAYLAMIGKSQLEIAQEIGLCKTTLSRCINGSRQFPPEMKERLSILLDISIEEIEGNKIMPKWQKAHAPNGVDQP